MAKWRHAHTFLMLLLSFFAIDLLLISLELFGHDIPFVYMKQADGRIVVYGSDLYAFIFAVPVGLLLDILWKKEKWSWFSHSKHPHRNVFYIFLILFALLSLLLVVGGFHACASACEHVSECTVLYAPFHVEVLYACKPIIPVQVP